MTPRYERLLNNAAYTGYVRAMQQAGNAVDAIADVLANGAVKLDEHQYEGLIHALKIVALDLTERAAFIDEALRSQTEEGGE